MFRRTYDSLSMPVHLELLVKEDVLCMKNWMEITADQYAAGCHDCAPEDRIENNELVVDNIAERSLSVDTYVDHMNWPGDASGIFHAKLPASRVYGGRATGEELHAHMPDHIKASYADKMANKYFRCISYSPFCLHMML